MEDFLKKIIPDKVKQPIRKSTRKIKSAGKQKVFGIGMNKTGTTSLKAAIKELGFVTGRQCRAEKLIEDWARRDFKGLVKYCRSAQFFQDIPFSLPYTFVVLDHEFPNSKFILTVRNSAVQWYNSLTKFHANKWGNGKRVPTKEDLQNATYIYKGSPWRVNRLTLTTPEDDPYNKKILLKHYEDYNNSVMKYFRHRKNDLLVLNVSKERAYQKLCDFLEVEPVRERFPWKNKTKEVNV